MSSIILHMLQLSLNLRDGRLEWICDIPGVRFTRHAEGFTLTLDNRRPKGDRTRHQYCYMVADPEKSADRVFYATLFSGDTPEKLVRWTRTKGVSYSPRFSLDSGEFETTIIANVLSEPRVHHRPARINEPVHLAPPQVYYAKSKGKTDGFGGGEELDG